MLTIVLLLLAFICFLLAALQIPREAPRIALVPAGLMFWVLAELVPLLETLPHSTALHHHLLR